MTHGKAALAAAGMFLILGAVGGADCGTMPFPATVAWSLAGLGLFLSSLRGARK